MPRLTYPRQIRLRRRAEFQVCYTRGKAYHTGNFLIFVVAADSQTETRMGITVTRKIGGAVVRNRIKRLVRETFRQFGGLLPVGLDFVVVAKRQAGRGLAFADVSRELLPLFRKLRRHNGRQGRSDL